MTSTHSEDGALDYCAGIGGWEVALERRGITGYGIENAKHPRAAREANGLETVWDDLTTLPIEVLLEYGRRRVVGSFPCQPFSQANPTADPLNDPRAHLMTTGLDHLLIARPEIVCLENVRKARGLMSHLGRRLEEVGYSWDVRIVIAADYGLPQARGRALLVARRDGVPISWPKRTHADPRTTEGRLDIAVGRRKPWVTLSEALGRTFEGAESWANVHPCTTIVGSYRPEMCAPPTYRKPGDGPRQSQPGAIELSLEERLLVQGFPTGWQLAGPPTARGLQVGNAIPPIMAEVALDAVGLVAA